MRATVFELQLKLLDIWKEYVVAPSAEEPQAKLDIFLDEY